MPKKTTLRGQFLRTVLLMLACSLLVGLAVIVVVMIAFVKKVPDGEQFLMDSVSFLFGKEVLGPNGMIHVVVLAAIALCLLVVLVCVLLASRYTSRVAAALREFRRAADDLRSGELDFQILTYPERELDELAQALESVRQRLKATAAAEAAAQEERGLLMANLSHDLRTPITAIKGYVEGIRDGIAATPEKLRELVSAAEAVERAIGRELQYISGGASTSVHMVLDGTLPARVNHLRIGEFALLGGIYGCYPDFLRRDVFTLRMEVVECKPKPSYPVGELTVDAFGKTREYTDRGIRRRALCAAGRVDYGDPFDLTPRLAGVEVLGASSDHTILDVEDAAVPVRLGDVLDFGVSYGSLVYLTNTPEVRIVYRKNGRLYTAE